MTHPESLRTFTAISLQAYSTGLWAHKSASGHREKGRLVVNTFATPYVEPPIMSLDSRKVNLSFSG